MNSHLSRPRLGHLSRRAALLALGSLFAAPSVRNAALAAGEPPGGRYPFTLGIASGMPRGDSVVLWTRLAPFPHEIAGGLPGIEVVVRWELAEDERFSRGVRTGQVLARPEHAHSVHVEVAGLPSGAQFFYRFMTRDAVSAVGRTRTAPAADVDVTRLRLALASCQHYEQGAFVAHRDIAARDLDFVLFVGDYIYESTNPRYRLRAHEGPVPTTLDGYRARHATYKLDPDLRAAHAAHPWVLTWDDHEVENDYADDHGPKELDQPQRFLQRRAAAYKAYFEHLPVSPSMAPNGPAMRIHERFVWGRLAELWTLDNRQYRSVQVCGGTPGVGGRIAAPCDEIGADERSVFGMAQERWLAQGLAASTRRWKLLGQGTQLSPSGVDSPLGRRIHTDGWDGYPKARERLLHAIADPGVGNVLNLGGDVHRHVAAQLRLRPNDPTSPIVASEFVCSSVTTRGLSEAVLGLMRSSNPDLLHARSDERGYALLEITPQHTVCDFLGTPFPARSDAHLNVQARFAVESGHAGVVTG
jgi:alkaline phosphatase D